MLTDVSQFPVDLSKKKFGHLFFQVEFQARDCSKQKMGLEKKEKQGGKECLAIYFVIFRREHR